MRVRLSKTSPVDFCLFERRVRLWLIRLGLTDWCIQFRHSKKKTDYRALVSYDTKEREAVFTLSVCWGTSTISHGEINLVALHEVLHLLLADLTDLLPSNKKSIVLEHATMRRLEYALLGRQ